MSKFLLHTAVIAVVIYSYASLNRSFDLQLPYLGASLIVSALFLTILGHISANHFQFKNLWSQPLRPPSSPLFVAQPGPISPDPDPFDLKWYQRFTTRFRGFRARRVRLPVTVSEIRWGSVGISSVGLFLTILGTKEALAYLSYAPFTKSVIYLFLLVTVALSIFQSWASPLIKLANVAAIFFAIGSAYHLVGRWTASQQDLPGFLWEFVVVAAYCCLNWGLENISTRRPRESVTAICLITGVILLLSALPLYHGGWSTAFSDVEGIAVMALAIVGYIGGLTLAYSMSNPDVRIMVSFFAYAGFLFFLFNIHSPVATNTDTIFFTALFGFCMYNLTPRIRVVA